MADAKHTPGPWDLEFGHQQKDSGLTYWQVTDGADAIACNQFCWAKNSEANGRLIASAPDLLELAFQYRDDLRYPPAPDSRERRLKAIDDLIAKATTLTIQDQTQR
jgi:hypothetical protein